MSQALHATRGKTGIRKTREDYIVDFFVYVIIAIVFFATFYPFYLSIVMAFNQGNDSLKGGIYFKPRIFTTYNFERIFSEPEWGTAMLITAGRTILGTMVTVTCTSILAYGLSVRELVGRKFYMMLIIIAMYFSGGVIPYYVLLRSLKLLNTFWVYIIPGAINMFYVLVSINFYQSIPSALKESAQIDGAKEMRIFRTIIVPLSKPLLATIAIFTAVGHWNSWYDSVFFVNKKELRTLGHMLMAIINRSDTSNAADAYAQAVSESQGVTTFSMQLAAMVVAVAPILAVYPFFQRYFVTGLTLGAVKG